MARTSSRRVGYGIMLVMAVFVASCGGPGGGDGGEAAVGGNVDADVGAAAGTTMMGEVDESEYDKDARFVWAARTMARSLNPHLTPFTGGSVPSLTMLHDRLTYTDPYTAEIQPMLATDWEVSEDGKAVIFSLRDDVTYHDGEKFDAASLVANFDYGKAMGPAHPEAAGYELIESAEVIDEFSVQYNLTDAAGGAIPSLMSGGLGMPVSPASFDREDHKTYDGGTGPYMIKEVVPGQSHTMVPFPDYYDPDDQNIGELEVYLETNEDTTLNAIATGQVDAAALAATVAQRAEASGLQVVSGLSNTAWIVGFNIELTEMTDPRVRQALNMAIDRQQISDGPLGGECVPTVQPWNENHPGHNPDYPGDYYTYDPAGARALLAEAGFPNGIEFEIDTYTIPDYVPVAEVIQAQLAEAGFTTTIRQLDTAQLSPGFRTEETLDTWFTRSPYGAPPVNTITNTWLPGSDSNPGEWTDEELIGLYSELIAETDQEAQNQILQDISARIAEAPSHTLLLCHETSFLVGTDDVIGLEPAVAGYMDFRRMGKSAS